MSQSRRTLKILSLAMSAFLSLLASATALIVLFPYLIIICLLGGCYVLSLVNAAGHQQLRQDLEYQNPGNTVRVVADNPDVALVSPGGKYMFRHYISIGTTNTIIDGISVIEDLTTGRTTQLPHDPVYRYVYWVTGSLFQGPNNCLQDAGIDPSVCAIPIVDPADANTQVTSAIEFVVRNSQALYVVTEANRLYGLTEGDAGQIVAYNTECDRACRTDLQTNSAPVIIWPYPFYRDLDYSPDRNYYAQFEQQVDCIVIYGSRSHVELARTCKKDFYPAYGLIPVGWNMSSNGYYFHMTQNPQNGDVFLLVVP